ncbi:MAG: ferrous iron transport protein A [Burkholderiaceae bacterium]|nr:ferrous iron transport protein A [Burkholderiaceae bacterium]
MLLKDLTPGSKGRVVSFNAGLPEYRRRLLALGVLPGTQFDVTRIAPLGDPIEIKVRGSYISVRKEEIKILNVEKIS